MKLKPGWRATSSGSTENWPLVLLQPGPHVTASNVQHVLYVYMNSEVCMTSTNHPNLHQI